MNIKVLTLHQPWASLFVAGRKVYETRPKPTSHAGMYLIHAAKAVPAVGKIRFRWPEFHDALWGLGIKHLADLPTGCIIGGAWGFKCLQLPGDLNPATLDPVERAFGDFSHGRYAWVPAARKRLHTPLPYTGGQGYYRNFDSDKSGHNILFEDMTSLTDNYPYCQLNLNHENP